MRSKIKYYELLGLFPVFLGNLKIPCIVAAVCLLFCAFPIQIYSAGAARAAGGTLLLPSNARCSSLAGAFSSINGDVYAIYKNPAGLSGITKEQISTTYNKGFTDDYRASVVYGKALSSERRSGFAIGAFYLNGGKMEVNYVNGTSENLIAQSDFLFTAGWGGYTARNVSAGYAVKYFSTQLVEEYKTWAVAADAGLLLHTGKKLKIGITAQNFGTKLTYRTTAESLPSLVSGGFSVDVFSGDNHSFILAGEADYILREKDYIYSSGMELGIYRKLFLRGGYWFYNEESKVTFGCGLKLFNAICLDVSGSTNGMEADSYDVSFELKY